MAAATALRNGGDRNGLNLFRRPRFEDIPANIEIPVSAGDDDDDDDRAIEEVEVVTIERDGLPEDPTELCTLLENENSPRRFWMHVALAYAKHNKVDTSIEILTSGLNARKDADNSEKLPMLHTLTWLFLQMSREARNTALGTADGNGYIAEGQTKEHYLQLATQTLNESTRMDPAALINTLARGIYSIFKASTQNASERNHHLDNALKIFEDAIRASRGQNMLALMGKARILYGKKRYDKALDCYQEVLKQRRDMDPDPRIGIGLCFWQLGFKDDAKGAWERALEIDPDSKVAHILMATYYLHQSATLSEYDPEFMNNYRQVIDHTQKAYKIDKNFPMACTTFASHFFAKKGFAQCEALAKKAIEFSDVPALASDAFYILARQAHAENNHDRALSYYRQSDSKREGGWLPAKIGVGQIQILQKDIPSAKLTFEAIVHDNPKCLEAKIVLGTLYAHEVLSSIPRSGFTGSKDDVTELHKKAIFLLESVRNAWKNEKRTDPSNETVLLTLARLYENDQQEKALQCLEAVRTIYLDAQKTDEEVTVPPQLLNNMAVLYWHQDRYDKARELFQQVLTSIPDLSKKDENADTDALATTLTYNLARCEEAAGNTDEAMKHYEQLLQFHEDYVDANMRLAYIQLRRNNEDGAKRISKLMQTDGNNLEVRALYGWYLGKQRRKAPINIAEDPEQRHYKHSLQHHDKHDRYSLTGMGNLYLQAAREMRRESEQDKEKRRKVYEKAVEFFDKALQLDPKNAYAAQGIAIAMVEDRRDFRSAVGILTKVRETLANDGHAVVNLGHCLASLEQWGRAIENYETALNKYNQGRDPNILSCLGRVWYAKGKKESKIEPERAYESLKTSLEYAKKALDLAKDNPVYMFNVAFVQSELVTQILLLSETQRTVTGMEAAGKELDEAVSTFMAISTHKTPPYPPKDIESRANMSRTTRKQLDRRIASQREYESRNAEKLAVARRRREEELRAHQEKREREAAAAAEARARVAAQRIKMAEEARSFAEMKSAEDRERDEREVERKRGRVRKTVVGSDESDGEREEERPKKKKKLVKKAELKGKFKSKETVDSSDEVSEEERPAEPTEKKGGRKRAAVSDDEEDGDLEMEEAPVAAGNKDDDDEDEE